MRTDCKRPWTLNLSTPYLETVAGHPVVTFHWYRGAPEGSLHHYLSYHFTNPAGTETEEPVYKRLFAHLALDELPDAAMTEVLGMLGDVWAFNRPISTEAPAPMKRSRARITHRYERPTYAIEE